MARWIRFQRLLVLTIGLCLCAPLAAAAQQKVQVDFWHGLTQPLGGILEKVAADFNASQSKYQVNATFKGSYPETMVRPSRPSAPATPQHCADVRGGDGHHDGGPERHQAGVRAGQGDRCRSGSSEVRRRCARLLQHRGWQDGVHALQ